MFSKKPIARFWTKVKRTGTNKCWEWQAQKSRDGHGKLYWYGCTQYAHRVSWAIHHGEIPKGLNVLHKCDNPACVNPDHLRLGTHQDNVLDRDLKGRTQKGEKHYSAKMTAEDVSEIRQRYVKGIITQQDLATEFGVSQTCIKNILIRRTWKHI